MKLAAFMALSLITFFHIILVPFFIVVHMVMFCMPLLNFVN